MIYVKGFAWCPDYKRIAVASATAKILCRAHNSALAETDRAAAAAFDALRQASDRVTARSQKRVPGSWPVRRFNIDGQLLERWFLKTTINIMVVNPANLHWAFDGQPADKPPATFVQIAFGESAVRPPMGLYFVRALGEEMPFHESVQFCALPTTDRGFHGALFLFRGLRFHLHLTTNTPPTIDLSLDPQAPTRAAADYHNTRIDFCVDTKLSDVVQLGW